SFCDRGDIYCSERCRDEQRRAARASSKRRYMRSFKGRRKTAERVADHRRRSKNVTDNGRQEVGQRGKFSAPAANASEERKQHEQRLDRDFAGPADDTRSRDRGSERDHLESATLSGAVASARDDDLARSDRALAPDEG